MPVLRHVLTDPHTTHLQYVEYVPVRKRKEAKMEQMQEQRRRERREPTPPSQPDAPKVGPQAKVSLLDQAAELKKEAKGVCVHVSVLVCE